MVYIFFPFKAPGINKYVIFDTYLVEKHTSLTYAYVEMFIRKVYNIPKNNSFPFTGWYRSPRDDGIWKDTNGQKQFLEENDFVFVGNSQCDLMREASYIPLLFKRAKDNGAHGNIVVEDFKGLDMVKGRTSNS